MLNYRREIDGLRALAVLPVIFFHAGLQPFRGGFVGVDVFFVISGYLITSVILAEKQAGTFTFAGFYERRARRILPALFVVMFACLPFAWLWLLPNDLEIFSKSLVGVSVFASNILFWQQTGYFAPNAELNLLLHTWSLAVEEQYYLLFPIFVLLIWRLGKRWIVGLLAIAAIISLTAAQWGSLHTPVAAFFLLPTRGWEILVGAFIAFYLFAIENGKTGLPKAGQAVSVIGLLLIVYSALAFDRQTPFPSLYTLIPVVGTAFIILGATQETIVGKLLCNRLLVGVGLISYSAYLWHQPLFALARHRSLDEPSKPLLATLAVVALLLAYLSWKYVETPFRNRQRIRRKQVFYLASFCSIAFIGLGLVGQSNGGFVNRFDDNIRELILTASEEENGLPDGCPVPENSYNVAGCEKGDLRSNRSIAVWGDSHARALVPELAKSFAIHGYRLIQYLKNNCPVSFNLHVKVIPGSGTNECEKYTGAVLDELKNSNVDTIIIFSRWNVYVHGTPSNNGEGGVENTFDYTRVANSDDELNMNQLNDPGKVIRSYKDVVDRLLQLNKKIILVYAAPELGWNVPTRLVKTIMYGSLQAKRDWTSIDYQEFKKRNHETNIAFDAIGDYEALVRIKPEKILCDTFVKERCVGQLNGVPLYFDDDHLSNAGALLVVRQIMKHIH